MNTMETFRAGNQREHIASLLAEAQRVLTDDDADGAVWRIADAGLLLRQLLESDATQAPMMGLDRPTTRGAMLPKVSG